MNMKSKTLQITVVVLLVMAIIAACSDAGSNDKETKKDDISTIRKKEIEALDQERNQTLATLKEMLR